MTFVVDALHSLVRHPIVRRLLHPLFAGGSRHHLARLDRVAPARSQLNTLLSLVHRARATAFGRDHDFARIRSVADFRRLVPIRKPAELWQRYPRSGQTWHEPSTPLLLPPATPGESTYPVLLSPGLLQSHRQAFATAFALLHHASPSARFLEGGFFSLGDDPLPHFASPRGDDSLTKARFPYLLRSAVRVASGNTLPAMPSETPSCILGAGERIVPFLEASRRNQADGTSRELWPRLAAVVYTKRTPGFCVSALRDLVGPRVTLLETVFRPEGPVAVEDRRHGGLRLLVNHGLFFELLPRRATERISLEMAVPGEEYELIISSPAGVWACRSGLRVRFERLVPPIVTIERMDRDSAPESTPESRLEAPLKTDVLQSASLVLPGRPPLSVPVDHPRRAGIPATLQETAYRNPW